jgi:hypothetical protein
MPETLNSLTLEEPYSGLHLEQWIAGIQLQGCEILLGIAPELRHNGIALLPSMALDTGIHAGMTARTEAYC